MNFVKFDVCINIENGNTLRSRYSIIVSATQDNLFQQSSRFMMRAQNYVNVNRLYTVITSALD